MYVVAGATGQTGSAVANWLLKGGQNVTVLARSSEKARSWKDRGAAIAIAELTDSEALRSVLADAQGAYLLVPPNYTSQQFIQDQRRVAESLAEAVSRSGIPHVVLLSSIGAQHPLGTGLIVSTHNSETALWSAAKALTIVRAAYFLENWASVLPIARESGALPTFLNAGRKVPMVATRDIGRISAESLLNPPQGRRIVELSGPQDYTPEEIAGIVAGLLNREVRVAEIPLSAAVATFTRMGFSEDVARNFREMNQAINSGLVAFEGVGTELHRGEIKAEQVLAALIGQTARA